MIVIGQDSINSHIQKFHGFFHIIRPKHIAHNAVFMSLIDHFLIEIRLKQLYLVAIVFYGTLHDILRCVACAAAAADIRRKLPKKLQKLVFTGHKIHIFTAIVFVY